MINQSAGLLPHADRWSLTGMIAGLACALVLIVADLVYWFGVGGELVARPFHGLLVGGLVALILAGLGVQCTVRIICGQRRLKAQIAGLEAQLARLAEGGAEDYGAGSDARVTQLGDRIAHKLRS